MKRNLMVIAALTAIICMMGCSKDSDSQVSLESLEKEADVIVLGESGERELLSTTDGENESFSARHKTEFMIDEVYEDKNELIKKESVYILEEAQYEPDNKMEKTYYVDGYNPMLSECEYILFLKYSEEEQMFVPLPYGKIPTDKEEYIYSINEIEPTKDAVEKQNRHKEIAAEVLEKYM